MLDDYNDIFNEPSEAEAIILKAQADVAELLTAEVKQTIVEVAGSKARLEQLRQEIRSAERRLSNLQKQVEDAKDRAEQAELFDVPAKYISKFVRNAVGDFAPGDTVWVVKSAGEWKECPTCNGRKKVAAQVLGKEAVITCPDCNGNGQKRYPYSVVEKRTIDRIYLRLCFSPNRVSYWNTENIYLRGDSFHTSLKYVFTSEEEALASIAKENHDVKT